MKYSIIINCYNTLSLINKCLEAALETTGQKAEIILVNNHPLYEDAMEYLATVNHPRVRVLDPGKNIGCMPGFQYGAERARGEYIVKLDDDVIVPKKNWTEAMSLALKNYPELAYVALKPAVIKKEKSKRVANGKYVLEFYRNTILFWCMMIKRDLWKRHFVMHKLPLYGVGERDYEQKAAKLGLKKAYLVSHVCTSLGRTGESDPLYGAWKLFYVKLKDRRMEFPEWRRSFTIGPAEIDIMKKFGYPDAQITEIQTLLTKEQTPNQESGD